MIDGYHGGGGPLEIYIYGLGSPCEYYFLLEMIMFDIC